jgi:putative ABC transport system permease protein
MLSVEQRAKEIGIRKVLGAAVTSIVMLIIREFVVLISVAFLIALPVAWYFTGKWLQDFAYRTDLAWWMFVLPAVLIMATALITMSFRSIKAALVNPAKSLKVE